MSPEHIGTVVVTLAASWCAFVVGVLASAWWHGRQGRGG